jgi:hypothetical protein
VRLCEGALRVWRDASCRAGACSPGRAAPAAHTLQPEAAHLVGSQLPFPAPDCQSCRRRTIMSSWCVSMARGASGATDAAAGAMVRRARCWENARARSIGEGCQAAADEYRGECAVPGRWGRSRVGGARPSTRRRRATRTGATAAHRWRARENIRPASPPPPPPLARIPVSAFWHCTASIATIMRPEQQQR